jgi:outer membrane protein OmpA-like peptidoglycan-associated protein
MRKVLVGIVALVSAAGGVAACGSSSKTTGKTPVAETSGVPVNNANDIQKVVKAADVKTTGTSEPGLVVNTEKTPKFTLELNEGKSGFKFRSWALSDEAMAKIDEMFVGDKFDVKTAHFEIEGYTDNLGSKEVNIQMAIARAKAVKQYLVEHHELPENCISVVGYGMEHPVADNSTPEGRAKNRRVVIKVVD